MKGSDKIVAFHVVTDKPMVAGQVEQTDDATMQAEGDISAKAKMLPISVLFKARK